MFIVSCWEFCFLLDASLLFYISFILNHLIVLFIALPLSRLFESSLLPVMLAVLSYFYFSSVSYFLSCTLPVSRHSFTPSMTRCLSDCFPPVRFSCSSQILSPPVWFLVCLFVCLRVLALLVYSHPLPDYFTIGFHFFHNANRNQLYLFKNIASFTRFVKHTLATNNQKDFRISRLIIYL